MTYHQRLLYGTANYRMQASREDFSQILTDQSVMATKKGRPPRSAEGSARAISVRLPPLTKLGLELLSNDSNVSLAQAVQFALWNVFQSHKLSSGKTVSEILAEIPDQSSDRMRQMIVYGINPHLTDFSMRDMLVMLWTSFEMQVIQSSYSRSGSDEFDESRRSKKEIELFDWFDRNWDVFERILRKKGNAYKSLRLRDELAFELDPEGSMEEHGPKQRHEP